MIAPYSAKLVWNEYLAPAYVAEQVGGRIAVLGKEVRNTGRTINNSLTTIVANQERIASILQSGMQGIEETVHRTNYALDELRSEFSYCTALMVDQLVIQNDTLENIAQTLDKIYGATITPFGTQAKERYTNGCRQLELGLLDEALEFFHDSEKIYRPNFFTQLNLGKLYLYGLNENCNVVDLQKAEKHLKAAVRYGQAQLQLQQRKSSQTAPMMAKLTAEAYFHASTAIYVQAAEEYRKSENLVDPELEEKLKEIDIKFDDAYKDLCDLMHRELAGILFPGKKHRNEWSNSLRTLRQLIDSHSFYSTDRRDLAEKLEKSNFLEHLMKSYYLTSDDIKIAAEELEELKSYRYDLSKLVKADQAQQDQAKDKFKIRLTEALNLVKSSLELNPNFSEAYYHAAKYAALLGDKATVRGYIIDSIRNDSKYAVKAALDTDFDEVRNCVEIAIDDVKNRYSNVIRKGLDIIKNGISIFTGHPLYLFTGIEELKQVEQRMENLWLFHGKEIVKLYQKRYDRPIEEQIRSLFGVGDVVKKEEYSFLELIAGKQDMPHSFSRAIEQQKETYDLVYSGWESLQSYASSLETRLAQNTFMDSADAFEKFPPLWNLWETLLPSPIPILVSSDEANKLLPKLISAYKAKISAFESRLKNKQCVLCGKSSRNFLEKLFFGEVTPACGCTIYQSDFVQARGVG